uniref:Putative RNI superfamily protein n=1 Tax=Davidia involucrata TaxID=16924 RepID=A0A5B7BW68_DAVIN
MVGTIGNIHLHDLPDVILFKIFSSVPDMRTCNAISLVCLKWHLVERSTQTSLALRGNIRDLFLVPTCFRSITHLDLSLLSPWGHHDWYPILQVDRQSDDLEIIYKKQYQCLSDVI